MSEAAGRSRFVEASLARYKELTMARLLEYLPSKEPRRYLYDLLPVYPLRSGKGLRPALCIAACCAFGGEVRRVLESAVAIELYHNAFLIHDDIEDGSESRRGLPTLQADQGLAVALNVGDAMQVLCIRLLLNNLGIVGPQLTWRIVNEIEHMVCQTVEGQALELGWVRDNVAELSEEDYLRMVLKKTCWYTCMHPLRIGALVAGGGAIALERFDRFGYYMGAAFQIQDDILNLDADEGKYGKEINGDLWEGKRTLMLIHTVGHASDGEKQRIRDFLSVPRAARRQAEVDWLRATMDKYDSIAHARSSARQLAGAALHEFDQHFGALPDSEHKRFLREVVLYMIERDL
ncbi:polyprenyl synthetase family protein [Massilia rubra]|uniref:polyprenyl synthetase family protein n=1 Tax=Massilia rubra TaxID=2607910 RepID=UPI001CB6C26B